MTRFASLILVLTAGGLALSGCCCGPSGGWGGSSGYGDYGIGGSHCGGAYLDGPGVTSDCGSSSCGGDAGCGCGSSCGCGGPLDWIFSWKNCADKFCGAGCGDVYWSDWKNHPPDYCDPCDDCGNFVGCGSCGCHNWWKDLVFDKLAWFRCDCGGCDCVCDRTGGGSSCCGAGVHGGVSSAPTIIEGGPPAVEEIPKPASSNRRRYSAAR